MPSGVIFSLVLVELLTFYAAIEFFTIGFFILSVMYHWAYVFQTVLLGRLLVYLGFAVGVVVVGKKKTFDFFITSLEGKKSLEVFLKRFVWILRTRT